MEAAAGAILVAASSRLPVVNALVISALHSLPVQAKAPAQMVAAASGGKSHQQTSLLLTLVGVLFG